MFLGVTLDVLQVPSSGWGILIGWIIWLLIGVTSIELYQRFIEKKKGKKVFV
jgi:hypothetical protein